MAGITDKEARALLAKGQQSGKRTTLADGSVPGLTLIAMPSGIGSWRLRYYAGSKQKEVAIGQYPTWSIADARAKAKELRRAVDDGADVALEKQKKKQEALAAITVDKLAAEYFEKMEKGMAMKTGMRLIP